MLALTVDSVTATPSYYVSSFLLFNMLSKLKGVWYCICPVLFVCLLYIQYSYTVLTTVRIDNENYITKYQTVSLRVSVRWFLTLCAYGEVSIHWRSSLFPSLEQILGRTELWAFSFLNQHHIRRWCSHHYS